jgi:hypothetical protein
MQVVCTQCVAIGLSDWSRKCVCFQVAYTVTSAKPATLSWYQARRVARIARLDMLLLLLGAVAGPNTTVEAGAGSAA